MGRGNTPIEELHTATALVRHTYRPKSAIYENEVDPSKPLDPASLQVLVAIFRSPGTTTTALADELAFNHSSVSNAVKRLKNAEMVESKDSKSDKRSSHLLISVRGKARIKMILAHIPADGS